MSKTKAAKRPRSPKEEKPTALMRFSYSDTERRFEIDPFDLTGEEEVMIEEFFDKPLGVLYREGWMQASRKAQIYLAFLARRREEPSFTYEDALSFEAHVKPEEDEEASGEADKRPTGGSRNSGSRS